MACQPLIHFVFPVSPHIPINIQENTVCEVVISNYYITPMASISTFSVVSNDMMLTCLPRVSSLYFVVRTGGVEFYELTFASVCQTIPKRGVIPEVFSAEFRGDATRPRRSVVIKRVDFTRDISFCELKVDLVFTDS